MQYAQLKKIPNVDIDDIYTGNGVSELINLSMSALLDDGDEMLSLLRIILYGRLVQRLLVGKQFIISVMNSLSGILIWKISSER